MYVGMCTSQVDVVSIAGITERATVQLPLMTMKVIPFMKQYCWCHTYTSFPLVALDVVADGTKDITDWVQILLMNGCIGLLTEFGLVKNTINKYMWISMVQLTIYAYMERCVNKIKASVFEYSICKVFLVITWLYSGHFL